MNVLKVVPFKLFLTGLTLAGLLVGCSQKPAEQSSPGYDLNDPKKSDQIILEINEADYSNSDFAHYVSLLADEDAQNLTLDLLSRLFDNFVEEKLWLEDARRRSLDLSQEEKSAYLETLSQRLGEEESQPLADLDSRGIFDKLLVEKLTLGLTNGLRISPEETEAYYEQNKRDFLRSEMVRVSQILLDTEDKAVEIYERVQNADKEAFQSAAKELSQGVEASKGGELGLFELGQLPTEMEQVVFSLQKGEVSRVFKSSYGYHIFRLDDKIAADLASLDDVRLEIESLLINRKVEIFLSRYMTDLKKQLTWKSYPENLTFPYQRNNYDN